MTGYPAEHYLYQTGAQADPYPVYRKLLAERPVHWDGWSWNFVRYADVQSVLRHPHMLAGRVQPDPQWLAASGAAPIFTVLQNMMLFNDAPTHTRLRGLVNRAFTPRAVEALRGSIQQLADELIDQVAASGRIELMDDFAQPLPLLAIAALLGVPAEDRGQLKAWSESVAAWLGGTSAPEIELIPVVARDMVAMSQYFRSKAAERRAAPRDDLLTALAQAEENGDRLTADEFAANCILLLAAGHETTTNLIGSGMLALLQHPAQLALLRERPDLLPGAVEELLRFVSPVQSTGRKAGEDTVIGGVQVTAGQNCNIIIGAANRDPAQFAHADDLDVTRTDIRHLSFAHGAHYCVGAPLARLEGQIAFATLLRRLPDLALTSEPIVWRDNFALRGLAHLPLTFRVG